MNSPINLKLSTNHVMVMDLNSHIDDVTTHVVFLRNREVDSKAGQAALRTKLVELRRAATSYLGSSEADTVPLLGLVAECQAMLLPFLQQPASKAAAERIVTGLGNVEARLSRTATADECVVNVGDYALPSR